MASRSIAEVAVDAPTHLFAYCERAGEAGLFAEPLNAITNLAFVIGAFLTWKLLQTLKPLPVNRYWDIWTLTITMVVIGMGSALWHTVATQWAVMADVLPIYIFINIAIFSLFIRLIGLSFWRTACIWLVFQVINAATQTVLPADTLNGSLMYVPTFILLVIFVILLKKQQSGAMPILLSVSSVFFISLIFRTIDHSVCDTFPLGTHWIWHSLNAYVLYGIVKALLTSIPRPANA